MKIMKYCKQSVAMILLFLIAGFGCNKEIFNKAYPDYPPVVNMPLAAEGRNTFNLQLVDEPYTLAFGAAWGGQQLPKEDIPVKFAYQSGWIGQYNLEHQTSYLPMPEGSYSISGLESVIRKGATISEPLEIKIESKKLDRMAQYMIPITLVSAGNYRVDSALQTAWFRIDDIIRKETDITGKGTLTVSDENTSNINESSAKLVDGNVDTKYLTFNYTPDLWLQLKYATPVIIGAYTFTSANDAQDRDPKSWKVMGSNDGTNWETLETQNNVVFSGRKMTQRFEFENDKSFTYYRINIFERFGAGNGLFQMAEWRVISFE